MTGQRRANSTARPLLRKQIYRYKRLVLYRGQSLLSCITGCSDVRAAFSTRDVATIRDTAGELWANHIAAFRFWLQERRTCDLMDYYWKNVHRSLQPCADRGSGGQGCKLTAANRYHKFSRPSRTAAQRRHGDQRRRTAAPHRSIGPPCLASPRATQFPSAHQFRIRPVPPRYAMSRA